MADAPLLSGKQFKALASRYDTLDENQRALVDAEAERWKAHLGEGTQESPEFLEPEEVESTVDPAPYVWPGYSGPVYSVEPTLLEEPAKRSGTNPVTDMLWALGTGVKNSAEMASHSIWKAGSGIVRGGSGLFWRTLGAVSRGFAFGHETPISKFYQRQAEIAETPWLTDQLIDTHRDEQIADLMAEGNLAAAIGHKLSTEGWDFAPTLGVTKLVTGAMLAGQAARAGKLGSFVSRLGLWKFISTPGDVGERSRTAALGMAYASTPVASSLLPTDVTAVLADILENHLLTHVTGQMNTAIDAGIQKAIDMGQPQYAYQYAVLNILPMVGTDIAFSLSTRSAKYRSDGLRILKSYQDKEQDAKAQWEPTDPSEPTRPFNDPATTDGYFDDPQYRALKRVALGKPLPAVDSPIRPPKAKLPAPQMTRKERRAYIKALVGGDKLGINMNRFGKTDSQVVELMVETMRSPEMQEIFKKYKETSGKDFEAFLKEADVKLGAWRNKDFKSILREVHTAEGNLMRARSVAVATFTMYKQLGERMKELELKEDFGAKDRKELIEVREMFTKTYEAILPLAGEWGRMGPAMAVEVEGQALSATDYYNMRMKVPEGRGADFAQLVTEQMRAAFLSNPKNRTIDVIGGFLLGFLQNADDRNTWLQQKMGFGGMSDIEIKARDYGEIHGMAMANTNSVKQVVSALQGFKSNLFYGAALALKEGASKESGGAIQSLERTSSIKLSRKGLENTFIGSGINMSAKALDYLFPLVQRLRGGEIDAADMMARIAENRGPVADEIWRAIDQLGGFIYTMGYGPMSIADPWHERVGYQREVAGLATREALQRVEDGRLAENQIPAFVEELNTALNLKRYQNASDGALRSLLVDKEDFIDTINKIDEAADARARERTAKSDFEGPNHSMLTHAYAWFEKGLRNHQLAAAGSGMLFTHSYASLMRSALQRFPGIGMLSKELRMQSKSSDPVERRRAFAKQMTGLELLAFCVGLGQMGWIVGDKRSDEQVAAREAGFQRNSFVADNGMQASFERMQPIDVYLKAGTIPNELVEFYEEGLTGRAANDPSGTFDENGRELTNREMLWKRNPFAGMMGLINSSMKMRDPYLRKQMWQSIAMVLGNIAFNAPTMKSAQRTMDVLELSPYGGKRKAREIGAGIASGLLSLSGLMQMFNYMSDDHTIYQLLDLKDTLDNYTLTGRRAKAFWQAKWDGKTKEEALEAARTIDPKMVPYINIVGEVQEREPVDTWKEYLLDAIGMRVRRLGREPWQEFALKYGVPLQKLKPSFQYDTADDPSFKLDLSPEEFYEMQTMMATEAQAKDKLNALAELLDIDDTRNLPEDHPLYELSKTGLPISDSEKARIFKEQVASLQAKVRAKYKAIMAKKHNIDEVQRDAARDRIAIDLQP